LRLYIDRLYAGDSNFAIAAEKDGRVTDVSYPTAAEINATEWYAVNIKALLSSISMRSPCDIPLWGKVKFITDGNYLVPTAYIGALVAADNEMFGHLNPDNDWHPASNKDLRKMDLLPEQVTSGMNGKPPVELGVGAEDEGPEDVAEVPPAEVTVRRADRGTHTEWITQVSDGDQVWFARRLYQDAVVFYEATSWNVNGPWRVWHRDNSIMLALGVRA
jgi:hypothetical protein